MTVGGNDKPGVTVRLAFQGSGAADPIAVTDSNGNYTITGVPEGSYAKIQASGPGFQVQRKTVDVTAGGGVANFSQ